MKYRKCIITETDTTTEIFKSCYGGKIMGYTVEFGPNTSPEHFDSMEAIDGWLDNYITDRLTCGQDFQTEKEKFIENQITQD